MKRKAAAVTIGLVLALAGCSGKQPPPPDKNVFSSETQALDKAKQVDAMVKKQAADQKKAIDAIDQQ